MTGDRDLSSTATLDAARIGFGELRDTLYELRDAYTKRGADARFTRESFLTGQCLTTAHDVCTVTIRWVEHAANLVELGEYAALELHLAEHDRFAWWHRMVATQNDAECDIDGVRATAQTAARIERETLARVAGRTVGQ